MTGLRCAAMAAVVLVAFAAAGMPEIPRASAKALGVTRGKPFSSGVVFVEGKYMPPPYVVERWGNGIRINSKPVTGPIVPWSEFLKTQEGVKVTKSEAEPAAAPAPAQSAPAASSADIDDTSLDDLFDDDPKPKAKKPSASAASRPAAAPPKPRVSVTYSLDGEFKPNAATKALVSRINAVRTEIDRILRNGGFICFGESYSRVTGDSRSALTLLERLPAIQRSATDLNAFRSAVRSAGLVYLNEVLCEELFRNRIDYRKLQEQHEKMRREAELNNMIKEISKPLL